MTTDLIGSAGGPETLSRDDFLLVSFIFFIIGGVCNNSDAEQRLYTYPT